MSLREYGRKKPMWVKVKYLRMSGSYKSRPKQKIFISLFFSLLQDMAERNADSSNSTAPRAISYPKPKLGQKCVRAGVALPGTARSSAPAPRPASPSLPWPAKVPPAPPQEPAPRRAHLPEPKPSGGMPAPRSHLRSEPREPGRRGAGRRQTA